MPFHGVGLRVTVKINERITMEIINKNMMHMHISANRPYVYYHPLFTFSHMRYDATGCPQRSKGCQMTSGPVPLRQQQVGPNKPTQ